MVWGLNCDGYDDVAVGVSYDHPEISENSLRLV
jgi:hypothetical protein